MSVKYQVNNVQWHFNPGFLDDEKTNASGSGMGSNIPSSMCLLGAADVGREFVSAQERSKLGLSITVLASKLDSAFLPTATIC